MKYPYIVNSDGWTFFIEGKPILISSRDDRYNKIYDLIVDNNEEKLLNLLTFDKDDEKLTQIIETNEKFDQFEFYKAFSNDCNITRVRFNGIDLPICLSDKLFMMYDEGCSDFSHYIKFIENLLSNPSAASREQLYRFLEVANLPITQDGNFIAYKGLKKNFWSSHGNSKTRVISGKVDEFSRILNSIGSYISVIADDVDPNQNNYCSCGLHVGSYAYASGFGEIVVAVEVNPANVISVPTDCNYEKCRVTAYQVLNLVETKHKTSTVVTSEDKTSCEEVKVEPKKVEVDETTVSLNLMLNVDNISKTRADIIRNIESHTVTGYSKNATTIAQLCGSVGRKYSITRSQMLSILLRLGFNVLLDPSLGNSVVTL